MRTIVLMGLMLSVPSAYANWGGDGGGSVGTGAFRTFGTEQVEMRSEDLTIRLFRDRAKVQVDYVLKNAGDAVTVKAGFPSLELMGQKGTYAEVEDYHITAEGKDVPFVAAKGAVGNWKALFDPNYVDMVGPGTYDGDGKPCGSCGVWWLTSSVHFDKGKSKQIRITYESRYQYGEGGPSGDSNYLPDMFRYLLSPAATWKGPIVSGKVTIKAVSVDAKAILIKPRGRFKETPEGLVWEFSNLKPTLADNLEVSMNNDFKTVLLRGPESRETSWYSFEKNRFFFDFHDYKATASSTAKGFEAANIGDLMNDTAWVAGKNGGINESVTLTLNKPMHVDQIGIVPGYAKSRDLYFANSRVQELQVTVNSGPAIMATLPDEYVAFGPTSYKGYAPVNLGTYSGDAKTITLTVTKVYPGSKYSDLCISEVLLRKRLPRKPEVNGAR